MFDFIGDYITQIWGSTLPHRLAWAISVAIVFELLVWLISRRVRRALGPVLQRDMALDAAERVRRRRVILGLPLMLLRAVFYGLGLLIILRYLGFNTGAEIVPLLIALLAVAAIVGWRTLHDVVAGYFIAYDNLYAAGERVQIGDLTGTVIEAGLRHTRLKAADGREFSIANHTVTHVINFTRAADVKPR